MKQIEFRMKVRKFVKISRKFSQNFKKINDFREIILTKILAILEIENFNPANLTTSNFYPTLKMP